MALTDEQIKALYSARTPRENKRVIKGRVWVRGEDGQLTSEIVERTGDYDFGSFVGRAGSIRRSRKGATRRLANGRRKYIPPEGGRVVAYILTPQ